MCPCVLKKIKTNHQYCMAQSTLSPLQVSKCKHSSGSPTQNGSYQSALEWGAQAHADITGIYQQMDLCSWAISQILKPRNGFWDISHPLLEGRRLDHLSLVVKLNYTLMTVFAHLQRAELQTLNGITRGVFFSADFIFV